MRDVVKNLSGNQFVMQSDVKSYYASIDSRVLVDLVKSEIDDTRVI